MSASFSATTPWFEITPPHDAPGTVPRPRVTELIDRAVAEFRVVQLTAPAGCSKTSSLAAWARQADTPVAWVSLSRSHTARQRLFHAVVAALQQCGLRDGRLAALLGLGADVADAEARHLDVAAAVAASQGVLVLVLDDAHLVPTLLHDGIVATLLEAGPPNLHLVLGSRSVSPELTRLRVRGEAQVLGAATLAFSVEEAYDAARALGVHLTEEQVSRLVESTDGWAAAVRLGLLAGGRDTPPGRHHADELLCDFVEREVLAHLPAELTDLLLAATTCDRVDTALATRLSGRADAARLLQDAVSRGLFIETFQDQHRTTRYRWHPVFARCCQSLLQRADPDRATALHLVAAEALRDTAPLEAAGHALEGGSPRAARDLLADHWPHLVIEGETAELEAVCARMPHAWQDDPVVLLMRACCADLREDHTGARFLLGAAAAAITAAGPDGAAEPLRTPLLLARLMIEDDQEQLAAACAALDERLRTSRTRPQWHNAAVFLLGWTELRLRRNPLRAVQLLSSAAEAGALAGQTVLAERARANTGFALANAGDLVRARQLLGTSGSRDGVPDVWVSYDGGIESFTAGWIDYWQDRLLEARSQFRDVLVFDSESSYTALARIFLAFTATALGDPRDIEEAERGLAKVHFGELHGLPWDAYVTLARAKLAMAQGNQSRAIEMARPLDGLQHAPIVCIEVAALHLRVGDRAAAVRTLHQLAPLREKPHHVRVTALVLNALVQWRRGNHESAHQLLERSLTIAAPQNIARPYRDRLPGIRPLLLAHAEKGTHATEFLAAQVATHDRGAIQTPIVQLSPRELEVLSYMRGTMSISEIAAALYVSVNTIKTHQRLIYRKLGVGSRREAVAATRPEPAAD